VTPKSKGDQQVCVINAEGQEAVETVISSVIQESQDEQPLTEAQKAIKESS
jgi:phage baseplate assembly protein gpV